MARALKVYGGTIMVPQEVTAALGCAPHINQVHAFVAAPSLAAAADLMGLSQSEARGWVSESGGDVVEPALAAPHQVFVSARFAGAGSLPVVRVGTDRFLRLGSNPPGHLEALRSALAAEKAERKAAVVKRETEYAERKARQAETSRANLEAAERIRPLLERLGHRPDLLRVGSFGLTLPGEALEAIVKLAVEMDEMMAL